MKTLLPLLKGWVMGAFFGSFVITLPSALRDIVSNHDGSRMAELLRWIPLSGIFIQLVFWGMIPTVLVGAIFYFSAPRFRSLASFGIISLVAVATLFSCSQSDHKFYPGFDQPLAVATYGVAFWIGAILFWKIVISTRRPEVAAVPCPRNLESDL